MIFIHSPYFNKPEQILSMIFLLFVICSKTFFVPATLQAEDITFHVGYEDTQQPPYYLGEYTVLKQNPGVAVEMIQMLEEKIAGLKIQLHRYPWIRCTQYLEDGRLDGIFNASFKKERLRIGHYPWKQGEVNSDQRITTISYALYVHNDSPIEWDGKVLNSLGKGTIGAPRGYSIVGDLRSQGIIVEEVNTSEQIMTMLNHGRIAAGALQVVTADTILQNDSELAASIHKIEPSLAEKPYYLLISKQFYDAHPEVAQQIWKAIAELRLEHFGEILKKY